MGVIVRKTLSVAAGSLAAFWTVFFIFGKSATAAFGYAGAIALICSFTACGLMVSAYERNRRAENNPIQLSEIAAWKSAAFLPSVTVLTFSIVVMANFARTRNLDLMLDVGVVLMMLAVIAFYMMIDTSVAVIEHVRPRIAPMFSKIGAKISRTKIAGRVSNFLDVKA